MRLNGTQSDPYPRFNKFTDIFEYILYNIYWFKNYKKKPQWWRLIIELKEKSLKNQCWIFFNFRCMLKLF